MCLYNAYLPIKFLRRQRKNEWNSGIELKSIQMMKIVVCIVKAVRLNCVHVSS